jgi:hypothetical protein
VSDVADLLAEYRRGDLTLDQLAQRFRERTWPDPRQPANSLEDAYRRELADPEPLQEGSFDEVVSAFHLGHISGDEYEVLARAAAEAGQ